jgi:hypothetical protein
MPARWLLALGLLVVLVALGLWLALSSAEPARKGPVLGLEVLSGGTGVPGELVISLPREDLETVRASGAERRVGLVCVDATGEVEFRSVLPFPFTDTDGGLEPPHVHRNLPPGEVASIETCRLEGTAVEVEGPLRGAPAG